MAAAYTGRGPETSLTEALCEAADAASVVDLLEGTARGRIDSTSFAPLVGRMAARGDDAARAIMRSAGERLGDTAVHVVRRLGMEGTEFDLILGGGLFRSGSPDLIGSVTSRVCWPNNGHPLVGRSAIGLGSSMERRELAKTAESSRRGSGTDRRRCPWRARRRGPDMPFCAATRRAR